MSINLGNRNGVNLNLIRPYQAPGTDRVYYFVDQNNDDNPNSDEISHQALDNLFNGGADTTTSSNRTIVIDNDKGTYTIKLPTIDELKPLGTSQNLFGGHWGGVGEFTYWTADRSDSPDQHALYGLRSWNTYMRDDTEGQFVALQVDIKSKEPIVTAPIITIQSTDLNVIQSTQISALSVTPITITPTISAPTNTIISSSSIPALTSMDIPQISVAAVVTDGLYKVDTTQYAVSDKILSVGDTITDAVILKTTDGKAFTPKAVQAVIDEGDKTGLVTKTKKGWQEQIFGSDGIAQKALVSMNTTQLLDKESSVSKDINKDGRVGDYITNIFDPDGLYKAASGAVAYSRSGLNINDVLSGEHDIQISAGRNWTTKSQIVGFVEHDGMGEILMKNKNKYSVQLFHTNTGLTEGGTKSVSASNVLARESYYGADLNFDASISNIGQNAMPTDWTQKNGSWF
jgi:hypothetical protein